MNNSEYDVVIIGAGQAGVPLSFSLAAAGKTVALAESEHLGGSCVNFGCTPTKAAIASARIAHLARRASDYGVRVPIIEIDYGLVIKRASDIARSAREGLRASFAETENPTLFPGEAGFVGKDGDKFILHVNGEKIRSRTVVINTGTRSFIPELDGLDPKDAITSENWLESSTKPRSLVALGAGYVGLEMAQMYRRLGVPTTVVDLNSRVPKNEDEDVSEKIEEILRQEDVQFSLGAQVKSISGSPGSFELLLKTDNGEMTMEAGQLFIVTGRTANTEKLGLEKIGIETDSGGFIEVDEHLRTAASGVYAAGDIRGGPMFTHTSYDDYRVIQSHLVGDGSHTTERIIPYAVFTDPELGRCGYTEQEARKLDKNIEVAKYDISNNGKATEIGETQGFIKVVADRDTKQILGAAVIAAFGSELVHIYLNQMNSGAPYTDIVNALAIHPTLSEAIQSAVATF